MPAEIDYPYRTRDGRKARIVAKDFKHTTHPIVVFILCPDGTETFASPTSSLRARTTGEEDRYDIFEYSPWNDVSVDTPVWVNKVDCGWVPRHFARVIPESKQVLVYQHGRTSHTTGEHEPSIWLMENVSLMDPTKTKEN